MPDGATTRDMALKLEAWAASLPDEERASIEAWMALGTGSSGPVTGTRWWFEPSHDPDRLSKREVH